MKILRRKGMQLKHSTKVSIFIIPDVYTQHISLDKERFQIPEILFNPQDIGLYEKGVPDAIHETLKFFAPELKHNFL